MNRSMIGIGVLCAMLGTVVQATSSDQGDGRGARDWQGRVCPNCQSLDDANTQAASRLDRASRIATKLVAPNTCADPGPTAWFAEEEDHLSAFLNSRDPQYK